MLKSSRKALSLELLSKHQQYSHTHSDGSKVWFPALKTTSRSSTSTKTTGRAERPTSSKEWKNDKVLPALFRTQRPAF